MLHEPGEIVTFTREQVRKVDAAAVERFGIPGVLLMENAAAAIEEVALGMLPQGNGIRSASVAILCGPGNNGGDGFALARRLHNRGITGVRCYTTAPDEKYAGDALTNLRIIDAMGIERVRITDVDAIAEACSVLAGSPPDLCVDALFGTGLTSPPRPPMDNVIASIIALREAGSRVLAVDIPSGLDCDTGEPLDREHAEACVRADATVTLAGMKAGFKNAASRAWTGEVFVGDIGAPVELLRELGS